jgi:hypothetical protein
VSKKPNRYHFTDDARANAQARRALAKAQAAAQAQPAWPA